MQVRFLSLEDALEKGIPTLVFLPVESHEPRSLVGYSPWGHRLRLDWAAKHTNCTYEQFSGCCTPQSNSPADNCFMLVNFPEPWFIQLWSGDDGLLLRLSWRLCDNTHPPGLVLRVNLPFPWLLYVPLFPLLSLWITIHHHHPDQMPIPLGSLLLFSFNWRIIALQYCTGFYHTSMWISHTYAFCYFSLASNHFQCSAQKDELSSGIWWLSPKCLWP